MKNLELEKILVDYVETLGRVKELKEELKVLLSEIEESMNDSDIELYSFKLEIDGDEKTVTIKKTSKSKEKFDKAGLAEELSVEKKDLTTRGLVKLAEDDKLTEEQIKKFFYNELKTSFKVSVK